MCFGCLVAQLLAFAAVAGVFGAIPIVSEWAFWFMVGAYLLWLAVNKMHSTKRFKLWLMITIALTASAIVGVFVEIPIVSKYAFWVMAASYVIIISSTDIVRSGD
jgi:hypothetical protein